MKKLLIIEILNKKIKIKICQALRKQSMLLQSGKNCNIKIYNKCILYIYKFIINVCYKAVTNND